MKRYVPIVIGIVALLGLLYAVNNNAKNDVDLAAEEQNSSAMLTSFTGQVTREFEGENVLEYGFDLSETSTTTVEKDGALVKVADSGMPVLAMYTSFEGGRGYSPADYIKNVIAPKVASLTTKDPITIGSYEWSVAESQWSVWHVAKSANGNWLLVVESKKADSEKAMPILESIVTR